MSVSEYEEDEVFSLLRDTTLHKNDIAGEMLRLQCIAKIAVYTQGSRKEMLMEQIDIRIVRFCVCANIRKADRLTRQFYDQVMEPSGLPITQFTLISNLIAVSPVSVQRLAEVLGMDRTTLTRNLEVLARQSLVTVEEGQDRRMRVVSLTMRGQEIFDQALPYWNKAQSQIIEMLGSQHYEELLQVLQLVESNVRNVL